MRVLDLTEEHRSLYFCCLEDWSDEMKEVGDRKECWWRKFSQRGLRVKLAEDDSGKIGGMIQYLPIEHSLAEGQDLYFILCIWVHGHKQGPGNLQKRGLGRALLQAAEDDARNLGARGMAAWGLWLPVWMKASWFKKQGYRNADRDGIRVLVWKPFIDDAQPPQWIRQQKTPEAVKVSVPRSLSCDPASRVAKPFRTVKWIVRSVASRSLSGPLATAVPLPLCRWRPYRGPIPT